MVSYNLYSLSVLITCHNRIDKTLNCLNKLYNQKNHRFNLVVFLVDDGSSDGTSKIIKRHYPEVNLILGDGSLYWCHGMHLAWKVASSVHNFDYYLWLNNDTYLDSDSLNVLFEEYFEAIKIENKDVLLVGSCRKEFNSVIFSYGGRNDFVPVIPNGGLQKVKFVNGNIVLVSKSIFNAIGNFSLDYTHAMGDIDYGLRVISKGFHCYTTKDFIATCSPNYNIPIWCDPNFSIIHRWKNFNSPLGLNIKEYIVFRKMHWRNNWRLYIFKAYFKLIVPNFYKKIIKIFE